MARILLLNLVDHYCISSVVMLTNTDEASPNTMKSLSQWKESFDKIDRQSDMLLISVLNITAKLDCHIVWSNESETSQHKSCHSHGKFLHPGALRWGNQSETSGANSYSECVCQLGLDLPRCVLCDYAKLLLHWIACNYSYQLSNCRAYFVASSWSWSLDGSFSIQIQLNSDQKILSSFDYHESWTRAI